jgi:hypothetical protein
MVNDLKNTLLIGLTVLTLGLSAWWLDPQTSPAQQPVDAQAQPVPADADEAEDIQPDADPAVLPPPKPAPPSLRHLLGIDTARVRLGKAIPTGRGITVGHVEIGPGRYLPDTRSPNFNSVTFVERSGASKASGHATATARVIYGLTGLAPGVNVVHCYESHDWMSLGYLNTGTANPPAGGPIRVLTHSWVSDAANAADVLRRADWQVDMFDTVMCVGVNNNKVTPVPYLLGTAYNVIAVGTMQPGPAGGSSGGYTRIEVAGRCKPDIVGPRGLTSFTTPAVAAVAARLLQAADEMTDHAHRAGKAEVIKAVLLVGAVKPDGWQPASGKPLDEHLGAGVLHFDNSLQVLQAGPPPATPGSYAPGSVAAASEATSPGSVTPGSAASGSAAPISTVAIPASEDKPSGPPIADPVRLPNRMGWDFRAIGPKQTHTYTFGLQAPMGEASIILNWHRRIGGIKTDETRGAGGTGGTGGAGGIRGVRGSGSIWYGLPRVANLNLRLYHTDENGDEHELAVSNSRVDNVEHIYLKHLDPGRYRLEVTRPEAIHDEPWDYALAWRVELLGDSTE